MEGWHGDCDGRSSILDGIERVKQQRDEILSRGQETQWASVQPTEAQAAPQKKNSMILNPYVRSSR